MERKGMWGVLLALVIMLMACGGAGVHPAQSGTAGERVDVPVEVTRIAEGEVSTETVVVAATSAAAQGAQPPAATRKIVYTASMSLRVDDPRATAQVLQGLARQFGGYVSDANIYQEGEVYRGTVQLRISAAQFDPALVALRGQATEVLNEQLDSADVTDQFVDVTARIENLERTEAELQILLTEARERGGKLADILEIQRELTAIREQIELYQGQLNVLNDSVALATINVELVPPELVVQVVDETWSPLRTLRAATRNLTEGLQSLLDGSITFAVAVLPFLLIWGVGGYLAYWLGRALWLRRPTRPRIPAPIAAPTAE